MTQGFRLDGGGETLVFLVPHSGAPRLAYWGPALPASPDPLPMLGTLADRGVPGGGLDEGEQLTWLPEAGQGFTGHPGLLAHRHGHELVTRFTVRGVAVEGGTATVTLGDDLAAADLVLTLALDAATGVLTSRARLTNRGEALTVDWLAAGALESPHAELMLFDGRWAREFIPQRQALATGLVIKENRTGRTSHHAPPVMAAGEPGFGELSGEVFLAHLAWSGDHRLFAERLRDGRVQLQAGELLHPGEIVLEKGEAYETPALHIARSAAGLNGLSDRLHPFVRDTVLAGRLKSRPRPVHYNSWEAIYFDHDLATLKGLADLAASVGVERFVLDDGWFRHRPDDRSGLGDWTPDPAKYPDGLGPLVEHVRGLGMDFGLWVEPEMANLDSDLLRAHPDWVLGQPGRTQPLGRGQYVLDLTRAEVAENIFRQVDALLRTWPIGYLKWDMNRDLTHAVSGGRAATHRQTLAVYELIDRLRAAHPDVEIESCSSGGGRADYGILARTDRVWTSDCNDPLERQAIQRGFSLLFPPEVMGAHVGPRRSHTTARTASLALRALTAVFGHMGVEADLRDFTDAERAQLAEAIAFYKAHRGWMHAGRTIRLTHPDPGLVATALAGDGRMLVSAAQVETPRTAGLAPLRLAGLDPAARWRVQRVMAPRGGAMRRPPALARGEAGVATGALLAQAGLPLPALRAGEIAVYLLEQEGG
ncbi:MAG TPA: alpha-galactosidase [Caulobacteraceae bacterium]|nr:alpha-galactosidase [Caulobacteraceae bacterium]